MTVLYPTGYGSHVVPMQELHDHHIQHGMDPHFAERLFPWIEHKGGHVGIGGAWRATPSSVSAASRAGHSFHQTQRFSDNRTGRRSRTCRPGRRTGGRTWRR